LAVDLDQLSLSALERAQLAHRFCSAAIPYPIALACYDLAPDMVEALKARGFLVFPRVECRLFRELANKIAYDRQESAA
jgi:hypothetical protein